MKKILLGGMALICMASASALEITGDFVAVNATITDFTNRGAALALEDHWPRLFGRKLKVLDSQDERPARGAIILSEDASLDEEEWAISSDGKNLHIRGGKPNGVFFGVAEFLERFGGCRWYFMRDTRVPRVTSITVPDHRDYRRKPDFPLSRGCSGGVWVRENYNIMALNRNSDSYCRTWQPNNSDFRTILIGCHSYFMLTQDLPADSPLLPISQGRRVKAANGNGPGQICFSNPDFRKHAISVIKRKIDQRKRELKKYDLMPSKWLSIIELSQNDNHAFCECPGCKKLLKKYGTMSGVQLDFINAMADAFPDFKIRTFAYQDTDAPPVGIKPRKNVIIHLALLSDDEGYYDVMRPLSHPANAKLLGIYEGWKKLGPQLMVWPYHRYYPMTEAFAWPQCSYWYIQEDFMFYKRIGAVAVGDESETFCYRKTLLPKAFAKLHTYLSQKLQNDLQQDVQKLIDDYFDYHYGPAAPLMKRYSAYLKKRYEAIPGRLCALPLKSRKCFDDDYFKTGYGLLMKARELVREDVRMAKEIDLEILTLDYAAINMFERFKHLLPTRQELCDRLEKNIRQVITDYVLMPGETLDSHVTFKTAMLDLKMHRNPLPIPPQFKDCDVIQTPSLVGRQEELVADPDAGYGLAIKLGKVREQRFDHPNQPMEFGVYNYHTKEWRFRYTMKGDKLPQNEQYNLIHLGRWVPQYKDYFWAHRSWQMHLNDLYEPAYRPEDSNREYDFYINCKITGPAYVKGSTKENAIYVDRIIAVKRGFSKK